ncbi:MAG: CoA transferase, partial [Ilumatobacteraceae bacterium]
MATEPEIQAAELVQAMGGAAAEAAQAWAGSGAMWLTGEPDGPPLMAPARVALAMRHWGDLVTERSRLIGHHVRIDAAALLGERAAITGMQRNGSISVGEGCQLLACGDGRIALSLTRDDDWDLVPAWLEHGAVGDWEDIRREVSGRSAAELAGRASLIGLACARVGEIDAASQPLLRHVDVRGRVGAACSLAGARVVDLSSLWAGPLCANILGLAGARVVKVESSSRPDGARRGPAAFFDLLHAGHESVTVEFRNDNGRASLRRLLAGADVVIEASRPRALDQLGLSYRHLREADWDGVWLSITAYGSDQEGAMRIGYGDDAAAAGGLVVDRGDGLPVFCADAVADPATGLLAASAVMDLVAGGQAGKVEVSLAGTAAHLAAGIARHGVIDDDAAASLPRARQPMGRAARL